MAMANGIATISTEKRNRYIQIHIYSATSKSCA